MGTCHPVSVYNLCAASRAVNADQNSIDPEPIHGVDDVLAARLVSDEEWRAAVKGKPRVLMTFWRSGTVTP